MPPEVVRFRNNLLMTLTGAYEQHNLLITGKPGCGKTSFLYSLLQEATHGKHSVLSKYFFYLYHATRAAKGENIEEILMDYILHAWEKYYQSNGHHKVFLRINTQQISIKEKLNKLVDYFKLSKKDFQKILIFVIDDADALKNDEVRETTKAVLRHLALSSVKKWLVVREVTYNNYDADTRNLINWYFADRAGFPLVSLYEIIDHRLKNVATRGNAKNPFSDNLCNAVIKKLYDGNMREGLSFLKNVLEQNSPGGFNKETDEKLFQNYLDKAAITTMLLRNELPNLYDEIYRSGWLPLPLDILCIAKYVKDLNLLRGTVNFASEQRTMILNEDDRRKLIKMRISDFEFSLQKLLDLGLIERKRDFVELTNKGDLLADYITRVHYKKVCEKLFKEGRPEMQGEEKGQEGNKLFLQLVDLDVNYWDLVYESATWSKILDDKPKS